MEDRIKAEYFVTDHNNFCRSAPHTTTGCQRVSDVRLP